MAKHPISLLQSLLDLACLLLVLQDMEVPDQQTKVFNLQDLSQQLKELRKLLRVCAISVTTYMKEVIGDLPKSLSYFW